jgi:Ran GTPase-activating protein (RanGAP) involved in mRNA processing and transport
MHIHTHAHTHTQTYAHIKALFNAIARNNFMTSFDLGCLGETGRNVAGKEGTLAACLMLTQTTTLTHLSLAANRLSHDDGAVLAEGLKANSSLHVLDLSDNYLADAGVDVIAEAAVSVKTLKQLRLSSNHMSDRGAKALAALLGADGVLIEELHMSGNMLMNTAAAVIGRAVCETNSVLTSLALDNSR